MRKIATPMKFKNADGSIRTDLTEDEQIELANYQALPLSAEEIAEREEEFIQAQAQQNSLQIPATLITCRKNAAENYPYDSIVIKLTDGVRADLTAYYISLMAGQIPDGFVLPWSESGYQGTEFETIYITKENLAEFCLGAKAQRERAFRAYAIAAQLLATFETPADAQQAFDAAFASTAT